MTQDLTTIISTMISNIGKKQDAVDMSLAAKKTIDGLSTLHSLWPNLTSEEKDQIKAIIKMLEVSYYYSDEKSINTLLEKESDNVKAHALW